MSALRYMARSSLSGRRAAAGGGRSALEDEEADERDRAIAARSSAYGHAVTSIPAALALLAVALGMDPVLAIYALFVAPMAGGLADSAARLVLYRID